MNKEGEVTQIARGSICTSVDDGYGILQRLIYTSPKTKLTVFYTLLILTLLIMETMK